MKHTQREWEVRVYNKDQINQMVFVVPSDYEKNIAERIGFGICECLGKDNESNARLIASAPELLEACKRALFEMENPQAQTQTLKDELIQAISKAEKTP